MMNCKRLLLLLAALLITMPSFATTESCRHVDINQAPTCPNDTNVLNEFYPAATISVSSAGGGDSWVRNLVREVIRTENPPTIVVHGPNGSFKAAQAEVESYIRSLPPEKQDAARERLHGEIVWVKDGGKGINWQQDFYQGTFNSETGRPALKGVKGYFQAQRTFDSLNAFGETFKNACDIERGSDLDASDQFVNGIMGGNIEGGPAGLCIIGDDHFETPATHKTYAKQACGNSATIITAPTAFLQVGHTDEIFKTIPLPGKSPPCNFALAVASPATALKLIRQNPQDRAFDFLNSSQNGPKDEEEKTLRMQQYGSWRSLCKSFLKQQKQKNPPREESPRSPSPATRSTSKLLNLEFLFHVLMSNSYAGPRPVDKKDSEDWSQCTEMTNKDLLTAFQEDPEFKNYNNEIEKQMMGFKSQLSQKIKEKLPQCNIEYIDMPVLYSGSMIDEDSVVNKSGLAIWPSGTNSIYLNGTIIQSDPMNETFREYIQQQYQSRGLKVSNVDTFFAHKNQGNIHCSTNTLQYCKP